MQLHKKLFVVFPGRFQPFHTGHKKVYDYLTSKFSGADVYITTTNVTDPLKSPFTFDEKKAMMVASGIRPDKILMVKNNYNIQSVETQIPIDINRDFIIFAVSEKDMADEPRFKSFVKKDGSPAYLQLLPKNMDKIEPAIKHGYLTIVPTIDFSIMGTNVKSATELRAMYAQQDPETRKLFVKDLLGNYNDDIYNIMNDKLTEITEKQKSALKKLIVGVIKEDDDFMNALIGPESKFKAAISNIQKRGATLVRTAQDVAKDVKPK
jgi:hypothetical protein